MMARKSADETQPLRPVRRLNAYRLLSPSKRQRVSDVRRVVALHKRDKIEQPFACFQQLESQTTTKTEILLNGFSKCLHRTPPGHGRASARNAFMSTLV